MFIHELAGFVSSISSACLAHSVHHDAALQAAASEASANNAKLKLELSCQEQLVQQLTQQNNAPVVSSAKMTEPIQVQTSPRPTPCELSPFATPGCSFAASHNFDGHAELPHVLGCSFA